MSDVSWLPEKHGCLAGQAVELTGLDHYRRLLAEAAGHLTADGGVIIQFDGDVLEAERHELPWLRNQLESSLAAA